MSRRLMWAILAVVVVVAVVVGAQGSGARTPDQRRQSIASGVRCPKCPGQSVLSSDAPSAEAIRDLIAADVAAGRSDDAIRNRLVARYGEDILLNPPRSGFAGLVWVIPVAAVVGAFGGLALAFRRWERQAPGGPSGRDRALVAAALADEADGIDDPHGEGSGR
ncbi:MAG TPA: cytochrome c-type biogenesis protein [Acidimicrobiales bacterium]|nr:cytochrome c-type biogenesis protein [Acidimicrobiales bacterium]